MIKINLLSPEDKDNFKWEKINNLIKSCTLWMLLVQVLFAMAFLFAVEYLKMEKNIVTAQLEQVKSQKETKEVNEIEKNLANYSQKIDNISGLEQGNLHWSYVFEEIIGFMPDGVRLKSVSSQIDAKKDNSEEKFRVDLTGNALTRKDLLIFEDNLKKSKLFFDIEYADSNYVESSDVDFRYSFYVYKKKLLE